MTTETVERTFDCSESPHLALSNIRGSVSIQSGEDGKIVVVASKHINSGDVEYTRVDLSQSEDGVVNVSTRYDVSGFSIFRFRRPCKVDYNVRVPKNCSLKVRGISNTASVEGISGKVDISSVSGELECRSLAGEIKLNTVSGDVSGKMISGPGKLTTVSGDVQLKNSDFPALKAKTVSGDMLIETPLGEGPYDFNAVSGDFKLSIPHSVGVTVISSSLSGDVRTSSKVSSERHSRNPKRVEIGGGGVEIHHHSVSGDLFLVIENDNGDPGGFRKDIERENSTLTRSEVLDRIASGELSVDEAVGMFADGTPI